MGFRFPNVSVVINPLTHSFPHPVVGASDGRGGPGAAQAVSLPRRVFTSLKSPLNAGVRPHVLGYSRLLPANNMHVGLDRDLPLHPQGVAADPLRIGAGDNRERDIEASHIGRNADCCGKALRTVDGPAPEAFECFTLCGQQSVLAHDHCADIVGFDIVAEEANAVSSFQSDFFDPQGSRGVVHDDHIKRQVAQVLLITCPAREDKCDIRPVFFHLSSVLEPHLSSEQCCEASGDSRNNRLGIYGGQVHAIPSAHRASPLLLIRFVLGLLVNSGMKVAGGVGSASRHRHYIAALMIVAVQAVSLPRRVVRDLASGFSELADSWVGDALGVAALFGGLGVFLWIVEFLAWEAAQ